MNYYYYLDNLPNLKVGDKVYVDSDRKFNWTSMGSINLQTDKTIIKVKRNDRKDI